LNLFGVVSAAVSTVNPREWVNIESSVGYVTNADGTRVPNTPTVTRILAQIQAAEYDALQQNSGINLSGQNLSAYIEGNWMGVIRADQRDGDVIVRANGTRYLVIAVPENFQDLDGWTRVLMTRQLNA